MIIKDTKGLNEFCNKLLDIENITISCDIETTPFTDEHWSPLQLDLYGIGIYYTEELNCYISHSVSIDYNLFNKLLENSNVVFHNAKFDIQVLLNLGIIKTKNINIEDTMIMSYLDDEERFSHGLKQLTKEIFKIEPKKYKELSHQKTEGSLFFDDSIDEEGENELADYCIDDCRNTLNLYKYFSKELKKQNLLGLYKDIELPFLKVLIDMEMRGIKLDINYLKKLEVLVEDKLINIGGEIYKEAGKTFDINSTKQLANILFSELNYEMPNDYRTPKGDYSTDGAALEYLVNNYNSKLAALVLEYRELSKLQNTYIQALPKLTLNESLHTSRNQIGTKTGRISSSNPNLQAISRRSDELNIRKAFIPRPGYMFITADYSQIELRVMAHYSQDAKMIETYKNNGDIHQMTADIISCNRTIAKQVNFGINYGRTAYGLAQGLGISKRDADKFINNYFENFPGVKAFMDKAIELLKEQRYVTTIFGRRRHFGKYNKLPIKKGQVYTSLDDTQKRLLFQERDKENKAAERQAANAIIQGSSADIMKIAINNISKNIQDLDAYILLQIHDEILVECPIENLEIVSKIIQENMENAVILDNIPLVAQPQITTVWEK